MVGSVRRPGEPSAGWDERVLNDGSRWQVFKRLFEPDELAAEFGGEILHAGCWFVAVRAT